MRKLFHHLIGHADSGTFPGIHHTAHTLVLGNTALLVKVADLANLYFGLVYDLIFPLGCDDIAKAEGNAGTCGIAESRGFQFIQENGSAPLTDRFIA
ncbi:hypothetical protein DSECCO2_574560 [anaerobic digester metagenome]